jgi:hypothetical protein
LALRRELALSNRGLVEDLGPDLELAQKHNPQIARGRAFQKRNRSPTVGAMLLRWRKPKANPPFTCVNMIPE